MKSLTEQLQEIQSRCAFNPKKVKAKRDELYEQSAVYDKESFFEGALYQYAEMSTDIPKLLAVVNKLIEQREHWMRQLDGDEAHMQFGIEQDNIQLLAILKGES